MFNNCYQLEITNITNSSFVVQFYNEVIIIMKLNNLNDVDINKLLIEIQKLKKENELLINENNELKLQLEAKNETNYSHQTNTSHLIENNFDDDIDIDELLFNELQNSKENKGFNFDLIEFFTSKGFTIIDKRPKGGALWILAGDELNDLLPELMFMDVEIKQSPNGGRTTKNLPAWFTKDPR